ncbi:MAG: histidine ammonia-lyase [Deltaproteobacteria bacterium]|nr:histidine ammonia-lyase [Deltaproteobacteria bacterium]
MAPAQPPTSPTSTASRASVHQGVVTLGDEALDLPRLVAVARHRAPVELGPRARAAVVRARRYIERICAGGDSSPAVYGVNTGFGALAEVRISPDQVAALQRNLVRSHAAGVGEPLPEDAVRAMMLLRAQVLAMGHSGVRPEIIDLLLAMLNRGVHPIIPRRGSVGASGDLAPLAHLALVLIGEGEARFEGARVPGDEALRRAGLTPIELAAKEGLSLVNGTQLMTAVGALALHDAHDTARLADVSGAISLEALRGTPRAFDARIQAVRPHPGQATSASNLRRLLAGSAIVESHRDCGKVQDPYSLRCMPQVHGATRDTLDFVTAALEREANSATDNPLIFFASDDGDAEFISGGNFHGQPIAMALDYAAIAVAELADIAERRIEQLVNPHYSGLPPFLVAESGLNSGFMMAQVTAAALVSENKILTHPASVDSIPSSAGREDHVSMGAHAALKLAQVVDAVRNVLAIELLCGVQGLDLRLPVRPAAGLAAAHATVRAVVPHLTQDRPMYKEIQAVRALLDDGSLMAAVDAAMGDGALA